VDVLDAPFNWISRRDKDSTVFSFVFLAAILFRVSLSVFFLRRLFVDCALQPTTIVVGVSSCFYFYFYIYFYFI